MTDFKPSVDTTIFPRRNFLQTRTERLLNRMAGGRVYQEIDKYFNRASLDLQFANSKSLTDSKTGKNLVTHTRASSATYVDGNGVIKNAVTNLLGRSQDADHWGESYSTVTNTTVKAPDQSLTAISFEEDLVTDAHYTRIVGFSVAKANTQYTMSVYAKAGVRDYISLWADIQTVGVSAKQTFDVANGALGDSLTVDDKSITSVGNGWYRCTMTFTTGASPSGNVRGTVLTNNSSDTSNYKAGVSGIACYLWGVQLEEGSTAGEYVKTTNTINSAPRFDHNPATGESLGLLVEEARTNLVPYSVPDLDNRWEGAGTSDVVDLSLNELGVFPGVRVGSNGQSWHGLRTNGSYNQIPLTASTTYTASWWYKDGDINPSGKIRFSLKKIGVSQNCFIHRNTSNPLNVSDYVIGNNANHGTVSNISVTEVANDVYRITCNFVPASTGNYQTIFATQSSTVGESIIALGFQIEEGAFTTSYIPTNGSSATRAADVTEITGNDFGTFNQERYSENNIGKSDIVCVAQPNAITSPDNTFTGIKLTEDASGTGGPRFYDVNYYETRKFTSGVTYTVSGYFKAGTQDYGYLSFRTSINYTCGAVFNLDNGTVASETTNSGWTNTSSTIEAVGNGWYRCTLTSTAGQTVTDGYTYYGISDGTAITSAGYTSYTLSGKYIYLWGMQREESSTATPYVKSDVTWTSRASNSTYYDSTGTLRKSSYNLLQYSEDFTNNNWPSNSRATLLTTTGVDNPFGGTNASTWKNGGSLSDELVHRAISNGTAGIPYTYSVWLRRRTGTGPVIMRVGDNIAQDVTSQVTTEWNRIQVTNVPTTNTIRAYIEIDGIGDEIDVWGAQLEVGTYAGDYVKTEGSAASSARTKAFLPDGITGNFVSAGELLLEDAGTNLVATSNSFSTAAATKTVDAGVAPDGTTTAVEIVTSGGGAYKANVPVTNGSTITYSVFLKKVSGSGTFTAVGIEKFGTTNVAARLDVNLNDGTLSDIGSDIVSSSIEKHANGWYRVSVTAIATDSTVNVVNYSTHTPFTYLIWGMQIEEGTFPTSHIPTYGATATRAADVSSSSSNTFGNSFYNPAATTVFADVVKSYSGTYPAYPAVYTFKDENVDNRITCYAVINTLKLTNNSVRSGGVNQTTYVQIDTNFPGPTRTAQALTTDSCMFAGNGLLTAQDNSLTMPVGIDRLDIGFKAGYLRRLTYWPERLPNTTLQTITT